MFLYKEKVIRRFTFNNISSINQIFALPESEIQHLVRVLRKEVGDIIEATDGKGNIFKLEITSIEKNDVSLKVISQILGKEIPLQTTALISELKNDRMDDSISLLAEYGIQRIIPFFSKRSIPKFTLESITKKQNKRQKIADEAVKKVGGLYSCQIDPSVEFEQLPEILSLYQNKILFWEDQNDSSDILSKLDYLEASIFIIGPEGGFSPKEVQTMLDWGCRCYTLGTRILRAPNAAAAACTLIRYFTEKQHTNKEIN
ncbi:MAG: RsmE family RNA methyltransferase [Brevinemataceae bacterium]